MPCIGVNLAIYQSGTGVLIKVDNGSRKQDKMVGSCSVSDELETLLDWTMKSATHTRREIVILY